MMRVLQTSTDQTNNPSELSLYHCKGKLNWKENVRTNFHLLLDRFIFIRPSIFHHLLYEHLLCDRFKLIQINRGCFGNPWCPHPKCLPLNLPSVRSVFDPTEEKIPCLVLNVHLLFICLVSPLALHLTFCRGNALHVRAPRIPPVTPMPAVEVSFHLWKRSSQPNAALCAMCLNVAGKNGGIYSSPA